MEFKTFWRLIWRWSWLLVLAAGLSAGATFAATRFMTPYYQASAFILVHPAPSSSTAVGYNSIYEPTSLDLTVATALTTRSVVDAVIANLNLHTDYDTFMQSADVTEVRGTQLVEVDFTDPDPRRAAAVANEIVRVYDAQNRDLQAGRFAGPKQYLQQQLAKAQDNLTRSQMNLAALQGNETPAEQARAQADLSQSLAAYGAALDQLHQIQLAETQSTDILNVVDPATPPAAPVRPRPLIYALLAAVVGGLLAFGAVFVREQTREAVISVDDAERLIGVPALRAIARVAGRDAADRLVTLADRNSPAAENYRMLAAGVEFAASDRPIRTVVVTSSLAREGTTITAANLAVAFAQIGKRVVLVDANLRRPRLHQLFGLPNERGLTSALESERPEAVAPLLTPEYNEDPLALPPGPHVARPTMRIDPALQLRQPHVVRLEVVPAGPLTSDPTRLLGSPELGRLIEHLRARADLVVFDAPPVLGAVDASLLAHACDATLLVVRAGSTRVPTVAQAKAQLVASGGVLLGMVLNRCPSPAGLGRNYYAIQAPGGRPRAAIGPNRGVEPGDGRDRPPRTNRDAGRPDIAPDFGTPSPGTP